VSRAWDHICHGIDVCLIIFLFCVSPDMHRISILDDMIGATFAGFR
jgi:hypothetical protein